MKSLVPWFCLVAAAGSSMLHAADGLEAYRLGDYTRAAESITAQSNNDPVANYYLGLMRLYGYGDLKNNDMALRYFTKAAEAGSLPAQKLLANYYLVRAEDPQRALEWFKKAAPNDVSSQLYVAAAYLFGYGVKKNEDTARRYYIDAARGGNSIAQYTLAENFLSSRDNRNKKMGLIWLTKSAQSGNPRAQFKLGEMYAAGNLVTRDEAKAKELLEGSAKQNFHKAIISLGDMAKKSGDFATAKEWFGKAANEQNAEGQISLAQLLLDSANPAHNNEEGFLWMLKAAQNGSHDAQVNLARMYKDGQGTAIDQNLAAQWQQEAQKTTSSQEIAPQLAVARFLSNESSNSLVQGNYGLKGIYSAWQNPSALKDNTYNQPPQMQAITRQELYKPEFAVTKPVAIPVSEYFDILAPMVSGNQPAVRSFPRYEFDGQIDAVLHDDFWVIKHDPDMPLVDRNTPFQAEDTSAKPFNYLDEMTPGWEYKVNMQAVLSELYGQAILGESTAQFELGQLYQYGIGVAKNIPQAISYFQLAAAQQDVRAEYNLGVLYLEGQTTPVDYQKGMEWMTDAAFKGNPYAQYVLANMYEHGLNDPSGNVILQPDHQQAMAMYYLASSNNFGEAEYRLADYLVKEKKSGLSVAAKQNRSKLVKRLYQGAVNQGIAEAVLPLAFYNAMDSDPVKQQQAFAVAKAEAQNGNTEAALLLGMMYERGISVPENQVDALYWYQQAGMSNPVTSFILGTYYSQGIGLSKDMNKGRELLQQSADAGFAYAWLNLAVLKQQSGEAFATDLDRARLLGNSKAGLLLADSYLLGTNDSDNIKQAAEIYQYFAEKGDKDAQMKLAFLYDRGLSGEPNSELALRWYTQAAEQGQPLAQYLLAQLYQLGRLGTGPDYNEAKKWYQASSAHYPQAAVALGFISDTVDDDYITAAKNYTVAVDSGDALGKFNLGLIYDYGKGRPVDAQKALELYTQAANAGYPKAMTQLANLYFKGIDGKRDEQKALDWYQKAASLGESGALYQLGLMSETGVATALNFEQALDYYQKAQLLGNAKAKLALARMYQYGLGVDKDLAHAVELYKQLATNNNAYAQFQLATIYLNGTLGEHQVQPGKALLQQASDNGDRQAQIMLQRMNAQQEPRLSFVEPVLFNHVSIAAGQSAELMYLNALSEWNRGDETSFRMILNQLVRQYPLYAPAKRAYEQLNQHVKKEQVIGYFAP